MRKQNYIVNPDALQKELLLIKKDTQDCLRYRHQNNTRYRTMPKIIHYLTFIAPLLHYITISK